MVEVELFLVEVELFLIEVELFLVLQNTHVTCSLRLGCYQKMNIHCFQLSILCVGIVMKAMVVNQLQEEVDF